MNHHPNLQAILFHRPQYDRLRVSSWANKHGYRPIKYHITPNYIRARLHQPNKKMHDYRTIVMGKNIKAITYSGGRLRRRTRGRHYGGFLSPELIDRGLNILANLILPAAIYGGVSYGIYRAVKK